MKKLTQMSVFGWVFTFIGVASLTAAVVVGALHQLFIAGMSIIGACVHFSENKKDHERER